MKLSILITTTPDRHEYVQRLDKSFEQQLGKHKQQAIDLGAVNVLWRHLFDTNKEVEIVYFQDEKGNSIGAKRNRLLDEAKGEYVAFVDSDDRVSDNYIELLMAGINKGVDCCSLKGIITEDGQNPLIFEHSIKYGIYRTVTDSAPGEVRYERYPNHLNAIKASIAKQFRFPEKNHSEDTEWATLIHQSGLIKTEHYIPQVIYYYEYRSKK